MGGRALLPLIAGLAFLSYLGAQELYRSVTGHLPPPTVPLLLGALAGGLIALWLARRE